MAKAEQAPKSMNVNKIIVDLVNKTFKDEIAFDVSQSNVDSQVTEFISTDSAMLNMVISNKKDGGIPMGRLTIVQGPYSSGKSSVAYHIAKNTQKKGGVVAYFDTENAFSWDLAERVGLNTKENFIYFTDISVEKVLQSIQIVVDQFVKDKQMKDVPLLIVWDSIAQTPTEKELEGDYDTQQVGGIAKVLTPGLRKLIPTIQKSKVTLLFINQERDKIGGMGFGEQTTTPGGKILQYAATVILRLSRLAWIKDEKNGDKDAVGIKIIAETKKNKIAPPMRKTEFDFFYSTGIDDSGHVWDIMAKNPTGKYYKRSGNTVTVDGVDYSKQKFLTAFNTEGKFRDLVIDSIAEFKIRRFDQLGKPDEDSDVVAEPDVN